MARSESRRSKSEQLKRRALYTELKVEQSTDEDRPQISYILSHDRIAIPLLGDIPPSRETYLTENDAIVRQSFVYFGSASLLAGTMKIEHFDSEADYVVVDPALPPFTAKTTEHYRVTLFGKDSGEIERVKVYTDYRRVKCYEDRFETRIGAPTMLDVTPDN